MKVLLVARSQTIWANFDYARELGVDIAYFFLLTPHPGTVIREELIEQGMVINLNDYTRYTGFKACVKTKHLSSERLDQLKDEIGYLWYPSNKDAANRIIEFIPKTFLLKLVAEQLIRNPAEVKGYFKRVLQKYRENSRKSIFASK